MTRKTIALFVLVGGMLGAFLVARLAAPSEDDRTVLTLSSAGGNDPAFSFGNGGASGSSDGSELSDANFTERVVQRYGEEILKLNAKGSAASGVALPSEGTLENLIADAIEQPLVFPTFSSRDVKTIALEGKEGLSTYFTTLTEVQNERLGEEVGSLLGAVARFVSEEDGRGLEVARSDMRTYLGDLLKVPVPTPLVPFHIGLLNLWEKRIVLADAILKSGEDPLKIVAAAEHLSQTMEEETQLIELLVMNLSSVKL